MTSSTPTPSRVRWLHLLALALGVLGFVLLVDRIGWSAMQDAVLGAGWWFFWIALVDLAAMLCDAGGIYCFARAEAPIAYRRVFAAQASGCAINRLTPGNSLGEPIKVTMLVDHLPRSTAIAAVVKFNLATLYVALAVIVLGVPLTLLGLDLPSRVEIAVWVGAAAIVVVGVLLGLLLRRGAIATLVETLRRLALISEARARRWADRVASIDASIKRFGDPWSRRGVLFVALSRVGQFVATVMVLHAAAVPLTPPIVIGMMSVGIIVTWMSNVVPLGFGIADGTNYLLYGALGSSPVAGLAFTMVNRTRTCVLAAMGLTVMLVANVLDRVRASEPPPPPEPAPNASGVLRHADTLSDVRTT